MLLSDKQLLLLLCVSEKRKIVDISKIIGRSQRTVQVLLEELEKLGYLENTYGPNGGGKTAGRHLTPSTIKLLQQTGHRNIK